MIRQLRFLAAQLGGLVIVIGGMGLVYVGARGVIRMLGTNAAALGAPAGVIGLSLIAVLVLGLYAAVTGRDPS